MSQRDYENEIQAEELQRLQLQEAEDQDDDEGQDDDGDDDEGDFGQFMPFGDPSQLFVSESGLAVADILSDCAASLAGLHAEAAKLNKIMTFMAKKMK